MIKIEELTKKYGTNKELFVALKEINLSIDKGESVAIMGKSGAGKTTLLNIIGCIDHFEEGSYEMNGINIKGVSDRKLAKIRNQNIGFVMQDFALVSHKTALFNAMLPMYFDDTPVKKMKQKALEVLEKVNLAHLANKKVNRFSGGEKQRVAIARAMVKNPNIILADEPTGSLDSKTGTAIMETLMQMNAQGMTLIVVTHDEDIAKYCKRKIVLRDGEMIADNKVV